MARQDTQQNAFILWGGGWDGDLQELEIRFDGDLIDARYRARGEAPGRNVQLSPEDLDGVAYLEERIEDGEGRRSSFGDRYRAGIVVRYLRSKGVVAERWWTGDHRVQLAFLERLAGWCERYTVLDTSDLRRAAAEIEAEIAVVEVAREARPDAIGTASDFTSYLTESIVGEGPALVPDAGGGSAFAFGDYLVVTPPDGKTFWLVISVDSYTKRLRSIEVKGRFRRIDTTLGEVPSNALESDAVLQGGMWVMPDQKTLMKRDVPDVAKQVIQRSAGKFAGTLSESRSWQVERADETKIKQPYARDEQVIHLLDEFSQH